MSGYGLVFHELVSSCQLAREAAACPVDADPGSVPRAAANLCNFPRIETLPGNERKNFAVIRAKPGERGRCEGEIRRAWGRLGFLAPLGANPFGESIAPTSTTLLVGEHAFRRTVEPEPRRLPVRDVVKATPGHEKRLRDNVVGILVTRTPQRVAEHSVVVRLVQAPEAIASRARICRL